jgi:hypothetical protein
MLQCDCEGIQHLPVLTSSKVCEMDDAEKDLAMVGGVL